jgi:hypothetical protein
MLSKGGKATVSLPYKVFNIVTHPGLPLYVVNSNHHKNNLAATLSIAPHEKTMPRVIQRST